MSVLRIPAVYMRGGTSKGVFFVDRDLPGDPDERDRLLLRVIGSPDRYGRHIDGIGGATSSTSKVVIVSRSARPGFDVDYLFGQVAIDRPVIDWSGNCGNLTTAVGPFAIAAGLVEAPADGIATLRLWQANLGKAIVAKVPMCGGAVQEEGDFALDGVTFPAAEIALEFLDPGAGDGGDASGAAGSTFPTGARLDRLDVPGVGRVDATMLDAGNPTIFVDAAALGLRGTESQADVNGDADLLARAEAIRAAAAVAMGLAADADDATRRRPHTPKLAYVAPPQGYAAAGGRRVDAAAIDLLVRIFSMGQLHHAMTGTGAVAIGVAAAVPGTLVHRVVGAARADGVCFGHPSGTLRVAVDVRAGDAGRCVVDAVRLSRSARRLMEGWVVVPGA